MNQGNVLQDCADDWMSRDLKTVTPYQTVLDAVNLMTKEDIGSVLVISKEFKTVFGKKGGELKGILTDTDIVRKIVAQQLDPVKVKVTRIMTSQLKTIPHNYPSVEMARLFIENRIKRLPVLKNGKLAGIMTMTDLMYAMVKLGKFYDLGKLFQDISNKDLEDEKMDTVDSIESWMTKPVVTIPKRTPVLHAAQLMAKYTLGSLPVITPQGYIAGIVTDTDLVKRVAAKQLPASTTLVDDVMTSEVVMASPKASIAEVGELMVRKKVRRLPIVDHDVLVGIVSITDVVSMLLQLNNISKASNLVRMLYRGSADYFG